MWQRLLMTGLLVVAAASVSKAQSAPPTVALSRELELEEQLQVMKDQRNFALDKNQQLELQVQQLQAVVGQVLDNMRADRVKDAADSRAAVSRKLVAAMKGDPDKGDRWDWERRGLILADGTFVPLVKPEDPKPAGAKPKGDQ